MANFGALLGSSQHPKWSSHYIDYNRLKQIIHLLFQDANNSATGSTFHTSYYGSYNNGMNPSHSGVFIDDHHTSDADLLPLLDGNTEPITSRDFQRELNQEIQKAVLFIIKTMGELASELTALMAHQKAKAGSIKPLLDMGASANEGEKQQAYVEGMSKQIFDLRMEYLVLVGSKLLLLLEFVELNVESVTKIVKKHDKRYAEWEESHHSGQGRMRSFSLSSSSFQGQSKRYERLRRQYLPRFARFSDDPNIRCLFLLAADAGDSFFGSDKTRNVDNADGTFGGWDMLQYNLEKSLRELFDWTEGLKSWIGQVDDGELKDTENKMLLRRSRSKSLSGSLGRRSSFSSSFAGLDALTSMKNLLTLDGTTPHSSQGTFFEPVLYKIQHTRRRLGQTTDRYARMVYAHEMLHIIDDRHLQTEDEKLLIQLSKDKEFEDDEGLWMEEDIPLVSGLSKFLNLMSSCLYMCNYNIVAPTSGLYAKLLGFDPANAGIIIGMTPLAVIGSSVLYSWWSSYSYKRALLFASFSCILGNIVYVLALPFNSLTMVLLGRVLIGFGSARVINRRYIADYYAVETRTEGMASFVSSGAFGMAVGPALAASFSLIAHHGVIVEHPTLRSSWTVETVPGYFMAMAWLIYIVLFFLYFEEPDRSKPPKAENAAPEKDMTRAISSWDAVESTPSKRFSCCNIPVLICLMVLVLLKSTLEGLTSSTPTVGRYYFGWNSHASGIYLALMASFVLPVNYLVANVSRRYDDREMIVAILGVMLAGIVGFLVYSGITYSETRFICASFIIFCSCNAVEAPTMGLLSKTIPKSMASGILNAGLLATEAGTIGRVVGDFYFSAAAYKGLDRVVNLTFEPMGVMIVLAIFISICNYRRLQPRYEDEEDED